MNNVINIGEKQYIKVPIMSINQNDKIFYIGKLTVENLEVMARLRPVNYDEVRKKYHQDMTLDKVLNLFSKKDDIEEKAFNRPADLQRADEITKYVKTESNAILPSTIIVGGKIKTIPEKIDDFNLDLPENCTCIEECKDNDWINGFNSFDGAYISKDVVYIPYEFGSLIVIDGQHRFLGLKGLTDEKKLYEVPITFLLGFKSDLMAETFYTVNFTQKSVDKSVLVHLKNTFLENITNSRIIYEYINFLNISDHSPLQSRIKILPDGKTDKNKVKKYISLAYLQQELEILVQQHGNFSQRIPIYAELFKTEDKQYIVLQNLLNYVIAFSKVLDNEFKEKNLWKNEKTVFTKAIGIVAILQVLPSLIILILKNKDQIDNYENIKNITVDDFYNQLKLINSVNYENYQGAGSLGSLGKLKKELMNILQVDYITKQYIINEKIMWIVSNYVKKEKD
ncbi:MAG: DGQHR domain-containing protein [Sulfuricurvum sp.]|nr:DGQHR domain-containing protein [Sulfuricurvum sp.]